MIGIELIVVASMQAAAFKWPGGSVWGLSERLAIKRDGVIAFEVDEQDANGATFPSLQLESVKSESELLRKLASAGRRSLRQEGRQIAFRRESLPMAVRPIGMAWPTLNRRPSPKLSVSRGTVKVSEPNFRVLRVSDLPSMGLGVSGFDPFLADHAVAVRTGSSGASTQDVLEAIAFSVGGQLRGRAGAWRIQLDPVAFRPRMLAHYKALTDRIANDKSPEADLTRAFLNVCGSAIPQISDAEVVLIGSRRDAWVRRANLKAADPKVVELTQMLRTMAASNADVGRPYAVMITNLAKNPNRDVRICFVNGIKPTLLMEREGGGIVMVNPIGV